MLGMGDGGDGGKQVWWDDIPPAIRQRPENASVGTILGFLPCRSVQGYRAADTTDGVSIFVTGVGWYESVSGQ